MPNPFSLLKPESSIDAIMAKRQPSGETPIQVEGEGDEMDQGQDDDGLTACAQDFINAVKANDPESLANAWRSAFEILESQPHEEAPHDEQLPEPGEEI